MRAGTSNRGVTGYPAIVGCVLAFALLAPVFAAENAASIEVQNADAKAVRPFEAAPERKATLLVFITHDCPNSNAYAPEIQRIAKEYESRGVAVFLVQTDPQLSAADAKKHAAEFGYTIPVLLDGAGKLSHFCGATVNPEAALFTSDGSLKYLGRIDDRFVDYGKKRAEPTRRDLRIALDEVLAGKAVSVPRATAVGCFIVTSEGAKK